MGYLLEQLSRLPDWLAVIGVAATPVFEIRGSLPFAVEVLDMDLLPAYFLSVVGNSIPAVVLIFVLEYISRLVSKHSKIGKRFFEWWFARTKNKFQKHYDLYGALALFVFVAIPLPMTGVWTGSVAAVLFRIRPAIAIPAIIAGACVAGVIVSLIIGAIHVVV